MQINIANEAIVFLWSLPFGMGIAVLYDFFRTLRIVFAKGCLVTFVQDMLFWIITAVAYVLFCFVFTSGEVRAYTLFGALLGAVLYFSTVSAVIIGFLRRTTAKIQEFLKRFGDKINAKAEECRKNMKK